MSTAAKGPTIGRATLNFTGRIEVGPITYALRRGDGRLHYEIGFPEWAQTSRRLAGRRDIKLHLKFRRPLNYGERPVETWSLGEVNERNGVLRGSIIDVGEAERLQLKVSVVNGRKAILARGKCARPDRLEDIDPAKKPARKRKGAAGDAYVDEIGQTVFQEGSLIHLLVDSQCSGAFEVRLMETNGASLPMPLLVVPPSIGIHGIRKDTVVQSIVLPATLREVITQMVMHECYSAEPWIPAWQRFAATLTPSGDEFGFFGDGLPPGHPELNPEAVARNVAIAVHKYVHEHGLSFPAEKIVEEED